jgi:antitoxin component HigA of HigAB toxin-antitoxin module
MLAVVKTPHTRLRAKGFIPKRVLQVLRAEYGKALQVKPEGDAEEWVDVFETEAYAAFKKKVKPGDYVRIYRENTGLSQSALAEKLGVRRSYVCDIEHYRREISKQFAKELSHFFHIPAGRFI